MAATYIQARTRGHLTRVNLRERRKTPSQDSFGSAAGDDPGGKEVLSDDSTDTADTAVAGAKCANMLFLGFLLAGPCTRCFFSAHLSCQDHL